MNKYQNMTPLEILSEAKTLAQESTVLAEKTKIKALSIESINKSENAVLNQVFELIALAHTAKEDLMIRITYSAIANGVYFHIDFTDSILSDPELEGTLILLSEDDALEKLLKIEDQLLSLIAEIKDKKEESVCA